jgi:hypothetical protein
MTLAAKLAVGSCVLVIGVCGVLAYVAGDDERHDFVRGSTTDQMALPLNVLVVDVQVDDEYEDTDEEDDRVMEMTTPTPEVVASTVEKSTSCDSKVYSNCKTSSRGPETPERGPQNSKADQTSNGPEGDNNNHGVPSIELAINSKANYIL